MLYIGNLVEFVRLLIVNENSGVFFPQNSEYSNTSELVKMIATANKKQIYLLKGFGWLLKVFGVFTHKIDKAFGNLCYDFSMGTIKGISLEDSIKEMYR